MANLGPLYQNQTYSNLLQVDGGLTAELKPVLDGDGNASGLTLSLTGVGISGLVADSATNLYSGTAGALPYQVNTNVTGFVTAGTPGQFLLSNGASAPVWTTVTPSTLGALASNGSNSMTGNLSMGSNKIVNLLTPVSGTDAATKAYVDSIATGLQVKAACRLATTTTLATLTGAATVDGVVVNTGDRVLVRAQTNPAENGIYVANVSTSPLGVWTRATDADTWAEIVGAATFITAGSTLANTTWVSNVAPGGTLDTTPITFVLFGASAAYTAGTGLSLVGSQFSLSTPVSVTNGGSGVTTLTGYVKGNGTSAMTAVASIPNTDISGLGTMSTQNANVVTITGGTINGTSVGATTASTGAFTDLAASGAVNFSNYINVDPLAAAYFTAPRVWDSSKTHWYRITPSELTDNRYVTLPLLGTNDTFVFENHAQTLTNKTLTSPVINGGSISVTTTQTNWDAAYADRLKWDGGSAGLNATTGRASLGLGNIATISTTGSTTNFLRADGAWAAPTAAGTGWTLSGSNTYTNNLILQGVSTQETSSAFTYCSAQLFGQTGNVGGNLGIFQYSDDASCAFIAFGKNRSTAKGIGYTQTLDGDDLGETRYLGTTGTAYSSGGFTTSIVENRDTSSKICMTYNIWTTSRSYGFAQINSADVTDGHFVVNPSDFAPQRNVPGTGTNVVTSFVNPDSGRFMVGTKAIPTYTMAAAVHPGYFIRRTPCHVATTANIALSGLQTVDGVTLKINEIVLVKNQTTQSQNGIYRAQTGAWTRYNESNSTGNFTIWSGFYTGGKYARFHIYYGTVNGQKDFSFNGATTGTVGSTAITFAEADRWDFGPDTAHDFLATYWDGSTFAGQKIQRAAPAAGWVNYSDARVKTIVSEIDDAIAKTSQLRSVIGYMNNDAKRVKMPMLIAQDVQSVLPEAVFEDHDEDKTLLLSYQSVIPLLVAAIKELSAKVDALENNNG